MPSKPKRHLDDAKGWARTHKVCLFDLNTGKYEVTERGGITSDGEERPSRCYVVVLVNFSGTCGRPQQYHFPCSQYIAAARHRNFSFMRQIPPEFTVDRLVQTWSPRFEPFLETGQWPPYSGPVYIADRACRWDKLEVGRDPDTTWRWIRFPAGLGGAERGRLWKSPSRTSVADAAELDTTHAHASGCLVRSRQSVLLIIQKNLQFC